MSLYLGTEKVVFFLDRHIFRLNIPNYSYDTKPILGKGKLGYMILSKGDSYDSEFILGKGKLGYTIIN